MEHLALRLRVRIVAAQDLAAAREARARHILLAVAGERRAGELGGRRGRAGQQHQGDGGGGGAEHCERTMNWQNECVLSGEGINCIVCVWCAFASLRCARVRRLCNR